MPHAPSATYVDIERVSRELAMEQLRQIEEEGFDAAHDDTHRAGDLAMAAGTYAIHAGVQVRNVHVPLTWPWNNRWWKPKDRRSDLVRAGALIIAEIRRLDREAART